MRMADPLHLGSPPPSVLRLNRRIIYLIGAVLIVAVVTGLIALRAQATRLTEANPERHLAPTPRSRPWFEDVPDEAPLVRPLAPDPLPPVVPARPPTASTTDDEEAQRSRRRLSTAMGAPIGVAAFERSRDTHPLRSREADAALVPARGDTTTSRLPGEYLRASVRPPASPYEVKAGTIIPAVMLTGLNSELPGQVLGQVRENVYDSATGEYLLVPQGTRLIGSYDHRIVYGQQRLLITWTRLVLPDGTSLTLGDGMPGTDALGAAGFHDQVDNHYPRVFGNALLLSVISAGAQLSQVPDFARDFRGPSAGNVLGAAVGQQLGSVSAEFIRRGMSLAPTLEIRAGYAFNVMVTRDMIFPGPYPEDRRG